MTSVHTSTLNINRLEEQKVLHVSKENLYSYSKSITSFPSRTAPREGHGAMLPKNKTLKIKQKRKPKH